MNFTLSQEQRMIQDQARRLAQRELAPAAARLDREKDRAPLLKNLRTLAALGYMGFNVEAQYGGCGLGSTALALALTELGRACAATAVTVSVTNMACEVIMRLGQPSQRERYLPGLMDGQLPAAAFALTEPGAGSDPSALACQARAERGGWVLNGRKNFITSAEYAGVFIVFARQQDGGISAFLVEPGQPGFTIGRDEEKMGQRGSSTNELIFDECFTPAESLLGPAGRGLAAAKGALAGGRIGVAAFSLGIALGGLETATRHAKERVQFGTPLAEKQAIQWMLADNHTHLEAARLLTLKAACLKDQGENHELAAAQAKLMATEAANRACYDALQILGGYGYTAEFDLERRLRDVRVTTIYEGSSEIQRLIIARRILAATD